MKHSPGIRGSKVPLVLAAALSALLPGGIRAQETVAAPDGRTEVTVQVDERGLYYRVSRDGTPILLPSRLGLVLRDAPPLWDSLRITGAERQVRDESWTQPWGQVAEVRNHYRELRVSVEEVAAPGRRFDVVFRAFDDGVAFRYELPEQPGLGAFVITDERTEFHLAMDGRAWWIPAGDPNRYELLYSSSPASRMERVHTPLPIEMQNGYTVVLHEANLVDYAGMSLERTGPRTLEASLARWANGDKVRGRTPFVTPWRTIEIADRVEELEPSTLALRLNPPSVIDNTDWIEPMKYVGIWWALHLGVYSWGSGPIHGATTENTMRYIDFAAENGIGGVLVEGWNVGWNAPPDREGGRFSFTEAYPDLDLPRVAAYAEERGVELIGHHETFMDVESYERQMEDAYDLYESLGIHAVKTGYVGDRTAAGHDHHGQYMVRHWRKVLDVAAEHRIALNVHEPIKDTGERRTYPNMMTREGARGAEYDVWGGEGGNPPEHATILFFTRLHGGPMDYTPGTFDIFLESARDGPRAPEEPRPRTTLAKQLALYLVLYSPLQMASDLPANYQGHPAFKFIRDVPVDWHETRVLHGKIGDYVVVARRQRDGDEWFVGAITDEEARSFEVDLSFLEPGRDYVAEVYADGPDAHWLTNPLAYTISERDVQHGTTLTVELAPGGGQAIRIRPR